ncbi:MAG TPA: class D sortase [Clostridiaceae bacterium]|nr:class D sortase [Clostridia bacterium]HJJ12932.1 class D sortase [Clostridiaceae bacterium]
MHNIIKNSLKATVINVMVALLIVIILMFSLNIIIGQKKDFIMTLINTISIRKEEKIEIETVIEDNKLKNYPEYGTSYATINIPKININLPVYYGDTMEILKKGVGHSSGSYFPGEGGSIVYMGHNSKKVFRNFSKIEKGDLINIKTDYGDFSYKVYDTKIVEETDINALPIQDNKEILMIYTCYPFNNIGYATQRYVVYAEKE